MHSQTLATMNDLIKIVIFLLFHPTAILAQYNNMNDLLKQTKKMIEEAENHNPPTNNNHYFQTKPIVTLGVSVDFIIVGAGSAGGVLANRLSEEAFSVLLIEAGNENPDLSSIIGLNSYFIKSDYDWGFTTTSQLNGCLGYQDQKCSYPRGKGLGGSSIFNDGFYVRGSPKEFDNWAKITKDSSWSFDQVLPYFKKSEAVNPNIQPLDKDYHGFDGVQGNDVPEDIPALTETLLQGFAELGFDLVDYNGKNQLGYNRKQSYLSKNIRSDTYHSFINPAQNRRNLVIFQNTLVTKIVIKNRKAMGVEVVMDGRPYRINATKNVILSAGAINSPQILMLSGIGPAEELTKLGIELIADLPVGKNLQDQVAFSYVTYSSDKILLKQTLNESLKLWTEEKGPLMGNGVIGFSDYNNDTIPEIQHIFIQPYQVDDNYTFTLQSCLAVFVLLHPNSIGEVTLASKDIKDYPLLNSNIFSDKNDLEMLYKGLDSVLKFNSTDAFKKLGLTVTLNEISQCDNKFTRLSKEWWFCSFKHLAIPAYHASGTTRMGTDASNSVVDSKLRVHGIENLRVVDTGVFPSLVSGPNNAAVVMVAEKVADIIKSEYLPLLKN